MRLLQPVALGSATAHNRLMFGPHVTNLGNGRGFSGRHVAYYERRAAGGAGIIVTETASVHESDWPYERAPLAARCGHGWAEIAAACARHGSIALAAIGHFGGQGSSAYSQRELWAPSGVPEVNTREMPKVMETEDIAAVVEGFAGAARRAVAAGLAGVEVNAGQHSLVRQFLSGLTNTRADGYGTDRPRFAREVLSAVKAALNGAVLGLRLSCDELAPWAGITPEQAAPLAADLAPLIDYLVVVRGAIYSAAATRPDAHTPPGFNLALARDIRGAVAGAIPVFAQGSIVDPAMAEQALADGSCDGVEMTRAQIADAGLGRKIAAGVPPRPCILCNQACQVLDSRNPIVSCVADPRSGHEMQDEAVPHDDAVADRDAVTGGDGNACATGTATGTAIGPATGTATGTAIGPATGTATGTAIGTATGTATGTAIGGLDRHGAPAAGHAPAESPRTPAESPRTPAESPRTPAEGPRMPGADPASSPDTRLPRATVQHQSPASSGEPPANHGAAAGAPPPAADEPARHHGPAADGGTARDGVLVIGGGPAGLEAARVAAAQGHRVRLAEASGRLGGAAAIAAAAPGRAGLAALTAWLAGECRRLGVEIELNHPVSPSEAAAHGGPVIVAVGGCDREPAYEVAAGGQVVSAREFLARVAAGDGLPAGPVLVWDPIGGPIGVSIAELLAPRGPTALAFPDQIPGQQLALCGDLVAANVRLQSAGVTLVRRCQLRRAGEGTAEVEDTTSGEVRALPAALVVDAGPRLPADPAGLAGLAGDDAGMVLAGDAVAPRTIYAAVLEGRRAALGLGRAGHVLVSGAAP